MAMGINFGQQKGIDTPYLKIEGNCLEIQDTCIQLSNISLFSTSDLESAGLKALLIDVALIIGGFIFLKAAVLLGLLLLAVGGFLTYTWYMDWKRSKVSKRLTIVTNSGNIYPIIFNDQKFLKEVVVVITGIIRSPMHDKNVTIDIKGGTFISSTIGGEINGEMKG